MPQFVNSKNGYLVHPGHVAVLAQTMIAAINNKNLASLGEAGYQLVKNYTWDKTAATYNQALTQLLAADNQH